MWAAFAVLRHAQKNAGKSIGEATLSRVATTLLDALDSSDQDVAEEAAATLGVFAVVSSVADVDAIIAVLAPPAEAVTRSSDRRQLDCLGLAAMLRCAPARVAGADANPALKEVCVCAPLAI